MQPADDRSITLGIAATTRRIPRKRRTPPLYILMASRAATLAAPRLHAPPAAFEPRDAWPEREKCTCAPTRGVRITDIA